MNSVPDLRSVGNRLSGPLDIRLETGLPPPEVARRIQAAVDEEVSLEASTSASSRRRLAGKVGARDVHLWVADANVVTRRKSWNIELRGKIHEQPSGATVLGTIDIPDRRSLRMAMWLLRLVGAAALVTAALLGAGVGRDGLPSSLAPAVGALLVGVALIVGASWLESDGERGASDDARLLAQTLQAALTGEQTVGQT